MANSKDLDSTTKISSMKSNRCSMIPIFYVREQFCTRTDVSKKAIEYLDCVSIIRILKMLQFELGNRY